MVLIDGLYGHADDEQSTDTIRHAIDAGATLIDTSDAYAAGANEELVGRAIAGRPRDDVQLATKWGIVSEGGRAIKHAHAQTILVDARPERAREAAEQSLRRLGAEHIDLWYLHFPDPGVPVEETVGAMAELVKAGKVRHLGLSNVTAEQVIAAYQVHPLGAGFLAGSADQIDAGDFRTNHPRFSRENLAVNRDRFASLRALAAELDVTPAQLALAWLLHQVDDIVPVVGGSPMRTPSHLDENLEAADIRLDATILARIEALAPAGAAAGSALL